MERDFLASRLATGRSIESIAAEVGRHPSTVAYWVNKHGLASAHAARRAPRGPIPRVDLERLVERGLSVRQIAQELDRSAGTIRHWLRTHGLVTSPARYSTRGADRTREILRECAIHGWVWYRPTGSARRYRCPRCNAASVAERRRNVKEILVRDAGGACALCGYDRCIAALHFHHLDRAAKRFHVSREGVTRSLAKAREEARKCVLLCANCHAEVEAGVQPVVPQARPLSCVAQIDGPG